MQDNASALELAAAEMAQAAAELVSLERDIINAASQVWRLCPPSMSMLAGTAIPRSYISPLGSHTGLPHHKQEALPPSPACP